MEVPIVKLSLPDEVLEEVTKVLKSGMWIGGRAISSLEEEFADYCGAKYCKAVNNGTSALLAIYYSLGLKPGDEVIIPSFSFIATANCLKPFGLKPVFADIDPVTFNIDLESIRQKITSKTKAIMPVHLYGLCADMPGINELAEEKDLIVIEDACQAHGAEINGKKAGGLGTIAAFSLYPTKNMVSGGEGGLITTNNKELYEIIQLYTSHGQSKKYVHTDIGFNFRMSAVNGVIALHSLHNLEENNKKRNTNAEIYNDLLSGIEGITLPTHPKNFRHVYHQYTIRSSKRDRLSEILRQNKIGFGVHYRIPIHQQEFYMKLGVKESLLKTEKAANEVISLPVHPLLSKDQIQFVADTIRKNH